MFILIHTCKVKIGVLLRYLVRAVIEEVILFPISFSVVSRIYPHQNSEIIASPHPKRKGWACKSSDMRENDGSDRKSVV